MDRWLRNQLSLSMCLSVLLTIGGCGGTSARLTEATPPAAAPSGAVTSNPPTGGTPTGSAGVPSQPPQPTPPPPQPAPIMVETIYQPTIDGRAVIAYKIDPDTGHLAKIGTFSTGAATFLGYIPDSQHRIYISNNGPSECYRGECTTDTRFSTLLRNSSTGALTIAMDNVLVPKRFVGLAVLPSGKFAYSVEWKDSTGLDPMIRCFQVDPSSGTLTQIDIGDVPFGSWGPVFTNPKLPVIYAFEDRCCATAPITKLHVWRANEGTGRLTELPDSPAIVSAPFEGDPTITSDGNYFYAAKPIEGFSELDVLAMDGRGMPQAQPLASISIEGFFAFSSFLLHPNGRIEYGWGWGPNSSPPHTVMHAYRLDPLTRTFSDLDLTSKMPDMADPPLAFDTSGKYLYLGPRSDYPLFLYNVDPVTGEVTFVSSEPSQ